MPRDKKIPKKNSNPTSDVVKKRKSKTVDNKVKKKDKNKLWKGKFIKQ